MAEIARTYLDTPAAGRPALLSERLLIQTERELLPDLVAEAAERRARAHITYLRRACQLVEAEQARLQQVQSATGRIDAKALTARLAQETIAAKAKRPRRDEEEPA